MFLGNQCSAFDISGEKRCTEEVIKKSYHCSLHYTKSKKLYVKYKQICNVSYNLDIDKKKDNIIDNIKYLHNCYMWFLKAYDARQKHRNYAFVPECYDTGHNFQFKIIKDKMNVCENKLQELYQIYEDDKIKSNNHLIKDIEEDKEDDSIQEIIIDFKNKIKQKKKGDKETKKKIEQYIQENKILIANKNKIIQLMMNLMNEYFDDKLTDIDKILLKNGIHRLLYELYAVRYFEKDFKPNKCKNCDCGEFFNIKVRIFCCECSLVRKLERYLCSFNINSLKVLYGILLLNKDKLTPIINELLLYYKIYGFELKNFPLELIYNQKLKRFTLKEYIGTMKDSEFKSKFRLKLKQSYEFYKTNEIENELFDVLFEQQQTV